MRILFYVEPCPIRNSMTQFNAICKLLTGITGNRSLGDMRVYANRETLATLTEDEKKNAKECLLSPTDEEQALFRSSLMSWDEGGRASWMELMSGGPAADRFVQVIHSIWQRFPFDVIVHWGENAAIRKFCEQAPAVRIGMELGCTRPPFIDTHVMDLFGTNGNGLIPKLTIDDLENVVEGHGISAETALLAYSENIEAVGYERQFAPIDEVVLAGITRHKGKIAFLPLQLYDDANLLLFSNYERVRDVVMDVVPKLADAGYLVLVKPHPASKFRGSAKNENNAAKAAIAPWRDQVVWCDADAGQFDNAGLISISDLVVTVNSSVGFEATYFDKPVVVLGEAVYKPKGLFPSLADVLGGTFDVDRYRRKLSFLRRFVLEAYLVPTLTTRDPSHFYQRVLVLSQLSESAHTAIEVARGYMAVFGSPQRRHYMAAMAAGMSRPGVQEFVLPPKAMPAKAVLTPGVDVSLDQHKVVDLIARATGLSSKQRLSEHLRKGWRDDGFRAAVLDETALFDAKFYLAENKDVAEAGMDPKAHFVLYGEAEGRSPRASINLNEYLRTSNSKPDQGFLSLLIDFVSHSNLRDEPVAIEKNESEGRQFVDFQMDSREEDLLSQAHSRLRAALAESTNAIAAVVHLYYRDLVPEILDQLSMLPPETDMIFTLPDWGVAQIERMVLERFPNAIVCQFPNRGRDIGPFIEVLPYLIQKQYQAVLKLHSKRGYYRSGRLNVEMGREWRQLTYRSLIGSPKLAANTIASFKSLSGLNMVGPAPFFLSLADYAYHDRGVFALHFCDTDPSRGGFFAGTMFWCRPSAFAPLVTGPNALTMRSFNPENDAIDGQLAHLVERLFGQLAATSRASIDTVDISAGQYELAIGAVPVEEQIHDFMIRTLTQSSKVAAKSLTW